MQKYDSIIKLTCKQQTMYFYNRKISAGVKRESDFLPKQTVNLMFYYKN